MTRANGNPPGSPGDERRAKRRAKVFVSLVFLLLASSSVAFAQLATPSDGPQSATTPPARSASSPREGSSAAGGSPGDFGAAHLRGAAPSTMGPKAGHRRAARPRPEAPGTSGAQDRSAARAGVTPQAQPRGDARPPAEDAQAQDGPARGAPPRPAPDASGPATHAGTPEDKTEQPAPQTPQAPTDKQYATDQEPTPAPQDDTLYLSVPRLGLYDNTVRNDESEAALGLGAIHLPETGFPWQHGANTYLACHRLGFPGTESYHQCLDLPSMQKGDEVILKDSLGRSYDYRVTELREVSPSDSWVANPVEGKDVVSLQTCIEAFGDHATLGPNWAARFVVQAERAG